MAATQWRFLPPTLGARLIALLSLCGILSQSWAEDDETVLGGLSDDDVCAGSSAEEGCSVRLLQRRALQKTHVAASAPAAAADPPPVPGGTSANHLLPVDLRVAPLLPEPRARYTPEDRADLLAGRSIYFVVLDRFARSDDENTTKCNSKLYWCGGTLKGLTSKLDYIANMGFDCLWITPVVKQYEGETDVGTGFMGYWAKNHYEIDPHYGTSQDLKDLVKALHDRGMTFMLDIVVNHVGPVHSTKDVVDLFPFNRIHHFHQLGKGDMTFDEYAEQGGRQPVEKRPLQAMWSGGQCRVGESCNCFNCQPLTPADFLNLPPPAWDACPYGKMVWNASSPCSWDSLSAFCMPGDYLCKGYDAQVTLEGWFYDLGDLNQSVPYVREGLKNWTRWMVETYDIDMLRLDTAGFVPLDFLSELQETAGVPIIGEVTATNMSYHASMQWGPNKESPGIDGVLNFPLYYTAQAAFCHTWFPHATGDLGFLAKRMKEQAEEGLYRNLDTLGNFVDNHDVDRLRKQCKGDIARMLNALAWTMLTKGTPIIYYGTEVASIVEDRESMWNHKYHQEGRIYQFIQLLNRLRKEFNLRKASQKVRPFLDRALMSFTRGDDERVWVYLNNMESGDEVTKYCSNLPPAPEPGHVWTNYVTGQAALIEYGCLWQRNNIPVILVQRKVMDLVNGNIEGWDNNFTGGGDGGEVEEVDPFKKDNIYHHNG